MAIEYTKKGGAFWAELNKKVEGAKQSGKTKLSVLREEGIPGNVYSYYCNKLGLKRAGAKDVNKAKGRFVEITEKSPAVEISYKGATITLRNPTTESLKQILNALEEK